MLTTHAHTHPSLILTLTLTHFAVYMYVFSLSPTDHNTHFIPSFTVFQAHMQIDDLFTDLSDGKKLMKLLEIISGEKVGKPNKGVLRVQKMENVSRCLNFLATKVSKYECTEFK